MQGCARHLQGIVSAHSSAHPHLGVWLRPRAGGQLQASPVPPFSSADIHEASATSGLHLDLRSSQGRPTSASCPWVTRVASSCVCPGVGVGVGWESTLGKEQCAAGPVDRKQAPEKDSAFLLTPPPYRVRQELLCYRKPGLRWHSLCMYLCHLDEKVEPERETEASASQEVRSFSATHSPHPLGSDQDAGPPDLWGTGDS